MTGWPAIVAPPTDGAAAICLIEVVRRSLAAGRDIDIIAEGLAP
jgi:hypothetical protein